MRRQIGGKRRAALGALGQACCSVTGRHKHFDRCLLQANGVMLAEGGRGSHFGCHPASATENV